jgi:hypothetical protein
MNVPEAREVLKAVLCEWMRPYTELEAEVGSTHHFVRPGPSGTEYQVDVQVLWDDHPQGAIRVFGTVDDGGLRSLYPVAGSYIFERKNAEKGGAA